MDREEIGYESVDCVAENRDLWQAVVNTELDLWVSQKAGY